MNDMQHEEIREMLGAYALNAMEALEHRRIERHIAQCEDCANEVRLLREAASELAWLAPVEDTGELEKRISANLPARRRVVKTRLLSGVAAVAIAAAGVLGANLVHERSINSQLTDVLASASRRVQLSPQAGFPGRGVLHFASGTAVIVLEDLPEAGSGRTYQLWALRGAEPESMTVVDGTGRVAHLFDWEGSAERFAITIEPDGGSPVPTTDPVLIGA